VGELFPSLLARDRTNCLTGTPSSGDFGTVQWGGSNTILAHRTVVRGDHIQQWSDAVTVSNCNKSDFAESSATLDSIRRDGPFLTECRNSDGIDNFHGHYFSWCFVVRYEMQLCPSPWRVPTRVDFQELHRILGYSGDTLATSGLIPSANIIPNTYTGITPGPVGGLWGGSRHTACPASIENPEYTGINISRYWSSTDAGSGGTGARIAYCLRYSMQSVGQGIAHNLTNLKNFGSALRCVWGGDPNLIIEVPERITSSAPTNIEVTGGGSDITIFWQSTASSTDTNITNSGRTRPAPTSGTYYFRARHNITGQWGPTSRTVVTIGP
jgi:hypothetical protein